MYVRRGIAMHEQEMNNVNHFVILKNSTGHLLIWIRLAGKATIQYKHVTGSKEERERERCDNCVKIIKLQSWNILVFFPPSALELLIPDLVIFQSDIFRIHVKKNLAASRFCARKDTVKQLSASHGEYTSCSGPYFFHFVMCRQLGKARENAIVRYTLSIFLFPMQEW